MDKKEIIECLEYEFMNYKYETLKMIEQGRVLFPLTDMDGNITGVIGRHNTLKPKYIIRGTGFFGNFNTERDEIIITEGVMDVITAQAYSYNNVVSFSCVNPEDAFNDDVLKRIAKLNKRIILFFDNDAIGQKSAKALRAKMDEYGIEVYNYQLDKAVDLIDFLKQGGSLDKIAEAL